MNWQNDTQYPQGVNRIDGLFIRKSGFQRDNFRFSIRQIDNGEVIFSFEARPHATSFLEFDNDEKLLNGGHDEAFTWNVAKGELSDAQLVVIESALQAYSNRTGGYARFLDGVGRRALVNVELVDRSDGF